jgi:uncharacterized protein (TIGR00251 family)
MPANPKARVGIRVDSRDSRATAPVACCTVAIKAIPNAPRSEVVGWLGEALKVKVHAPPVEGRANDALCEFLAATLALPRRAVTVLRGDTSRQKIVRIEGLAREEVLARLLR